MNTITNNPILRITAFCLVTALTFLASCDRSDNPAEGMDIPDMNAKYLLQPPAISVEPFGGSTPATRAAVAMKEEQQAFNVGEELGNIITLGNSEMEDMPQTRTLTAGAYCRIVVYKLEDWNSGTMKVLEQRLCKQGSTDYSAELGDSTEPIYLYPGSYKIFCYSFNETNTGKMAPLAVDGTANVPLSDGDDFMSVVIDKTITASQLGTNVSLGTVTLQHRCCQLIGILTSEVFPGTGISTSPDPTLSAVSTFTTAGNWSIKGTSFTPTSTAAANTAKAFTMAKSGNDYKGTMIILPLTSKALSASYNFKPNGASKNITASEKTVTTSTSFGSGSSYSFTIKAIGGYVLTKPNPTTAPIQVGSYKWAYANLKSGNSMETHPWVSGELNGSDQSYWHWNASVANDLSPYKYSTATWLATYDPCLDGLGNSWCVPTSTKLRNLAALRLVNKRVLINDVVVTTNAYGWVKSGNVVGSVFVDTGRLTCIFLPAAGISGYNKTPTEVGEAGYYWPADRIDDLNLHILFFDSRSMRVTPADPRSREYASVRCSQ